MHNLQNIQGMFFRKVWPDERPDKRMRVNKVQFPPLSGTKNLAQCTSRYKNKLEENFRKKLMDGYAGIVRTGGKQD